MNDYTNTQQYKYDAFISYSHVDKKAAVAFQRRLERYRIPKEIQMKCGNDSTRLKIFRDETDLPAGSLKGKVVEDLRSSKKLIVICSSRPAAEGKEKYKWVEQEVQCFMDDDRCDDILPISLDGKWEAMPANLKELNEKQFITDVSKLKRRTAFLKILSGVLDTDFDTLVKREKKRTRIKMTTLALFCCALFTICFYYFWPHTVYYEDYIMRFGKPEGIGRLTAAQRAVRSESFAITTTHSTHEIRLEHVNSAGLVSMDTGENHLDQIAAAVYDCSDKGQISVVTYLDETGKLLYTHSYAPDLSYLDIIKSKDDAKWLTLPAESTEGSLPVRTDISRCQLDFDEDGFLSRRTYSVDKLSAVNDVGIGGEHYSYDPQGRLKQITYLDTTGNPDINKHGIAGKKFFYNSAGHISRIESYGADGGLINNNMRYAAVAYEYDDANENISKICYYNEKGALVITADGYAQEFRDYDDRGFLISRTYFDDDDQPIRGSYRFHKMEIIPDNKGRDIASTYLDVNGSLILTPEHYAKRIKKYNAQGLVEDEFYYGEDGQLNLSTDGSCRVHYEYDRNGNPEEISHYGTDDNLIFSSNGYAVMKLTYNADGLQETESYFGIDNEPILGTEGYHKKRYIYDSRYNISEIHFTGIMDQPALCDDGYAIRKLEYDNAGNIESDSYFDDYYQPTYRIGSYSKATMKYDEHGHRILTECFNPDGTPADSASYSSISVEYDDFGRTTQIKYCLLDETHFMFEYEYKGSRLSVRTDHYFDGFNAGLRRVSRYDEKGNVVETTEYKENNLRSRSVSEFDAYGNMIQKTFYNAQDEKIRYFINEHNKYGLPTKTSYYNADGQLSKEANTSEHVAVVVSEYDDHNLIIERRCYDENGSPLRIINSDGTNYARLVMDYDRNGNCTNSVFYDEKDDVYGSVIQEYDAYNREVNRIYLDSEGAQIVRKELQYDKQGNLVSIALYDRKDVLQADPESSVAKIIYTRDSYGYVIGEEFYGAGGQPTAPYGTYHKYYITRKNGRSIEIRYYGTDGQLALNHDGYAIERFTYDERGNEIGRAFFGVDEKPIMLKWRFSRYEVRYDDKGNLTESRFYDTSDREVKQVYGYLSRNSVYIKSVPKRMLIFHGNDGATLMGDVEIKLSIPLQEFAMPKDDDTDIEDTPPVNEEERDETPSGDELPSQETEPAEKSESYFLKQEYITTVNNYVRAIEHFEGIGIIDLMDTSSFNAAATIAATQLGVDISVYKIYHFYAAFYDEELAALKASLYEKYGSDIYITYEILSEEYKPADEIAEANRALEDLGVNDFVIQNAVNLDIAYTVSGSNGQGLEDEGFLSRQLYLIQVNGQWKIETGEGFPKPSKEQLVKLYTGR